jgi:glycosyltransferase involved in cell wall biosynthesis
MNKNSIDIIVPTYRLNEERLLDIIHLPKPTGFEVSYYIISDKADAVIPVSIAALHDRGLIRLLIHKQNLGPAAARNTGIRAGSGKWILFLDDDIQPQEDLLMRYADAIKKSESAIGFVGLTVFPEPFNPVTRALLIGGWISHFTSAKIYPSLRWAPTSNILMNREKMDGTLFDEQLRKSGEDIEFLVRNSLLFAELYKALPNAVVFHPWWNEGAVQTKRMLRYGAGASEIARKSPVKEYTFRDFTNTAETSFILLLLIPADILIGSFRLTLLFFSSLVIAEYLTNWLRGISIGKTFSPLVAFHLMWAKNCYEAGFLIRSLQTGYLNGFALRIDMGFSKAHPGPFRTNRWKIIKFILIAVLFLIGFIAI